ncbi:MAG: ABC transporter ATP-binding protein/permease [Myxococcales bacterium]|nr:ABC transporter ATP-binding protein/permease [Myxococcales bacterium]
MEEVLVESEALAQAADEAQSRPGWRLIRQTAWEQRGGLSLGVLAGLCWTAGKVAVPNLVKQAIDRGIGSGSNDAILKWALLVGIAGLISALFTGVRRYMAFHEARRAERRLRLRMFAHIQRLHFGFHDRTQTGQLMSRANTDLQQVQGLITMVPLTVSNLVTVLAVTAVMAITEPLLALLALGSLPFVNLLGKRFSSALHPAVRGLQEESAQLAAVVEESVAGVRVVKGFGAEPLQQKRLEREADDVFGMAMQAAWVRSTYLPAIELIPNLGLIMVLGYGGHLVLEGSLTIGNLIMFNFYVILLVNPLRMLGSIIAQAERASAAADRVAAVLSTAPLIVDPKTSRALPQSNVAAGPARGEVRFEGVRFGYGPANTTDDGRAVLEGFDLHVEAGTSVAIVGATGCGKSTVAKLIPRFYDVWDGRVCIDGVDVRELSLPELRGAVGLVFEDTFLFSDSIARNIAFADPDASAEAIERAARLAGAADFIEALPEGYDTPIGERGYSLSGGQRQRIAIARAILHDPRVLLLDDATSSVDPDKEHEIREAMAEVMGGRTTIVIAHRPATVALADRVVLLQDGRIAAEGTHEQLLRENPAYRKVLAADAPEASP